MTVGEISGVPAGTAFRNREDLRRCRVHRVQMAGIAVNASGYAESVVLSGGFVDDKDYGDMILYTGDGGRDPATGHQIEDQTLTAGNKALVKSSVDGVPVRVIRGAGAGGNYAPSEGYRYDGLYRVESYWTPIGKDGFLIYRFRLIALASQYTPVEALGSSLLADNSLSSLEVHPSESGRKEEPSQLATGLVEPKGDTADSLSLGAGRGPVPRSEISVLRVVRDTALGQHVKRLYNYKCQICGKRLVVGSGSIPYAEAGHIRPLGKPHDGPDELANLLCLCPNDHVLFDRGAWTISDDFIVQPKGTRLTLVQDHKLSLNHIRYHRALWPRTVGL